MRRGNLPHPARLLNDPKTPTQNAGRFFGAPSPEWPPARGRIIYDAKAQRRQEPQKIKIFNLELMKS